MTSRKTQFTLPLALAFLTNVGCQAPLGHDQKADSTNPAQPRTVKDPSEVPQAPAPKISAPTFYAAGQLHERESNFPAAAEQYFRATQADPKFVAAYNRLGIVYDRMGAYGQAEAAFIRGISIAPDLAYLRNNLGFSFMLHSEYPQAERALREAIQLKPDYHRAQLNLGVVLARTERFDEAVDTFARALPRDAAYYNVGILYSADRRFDLAHVAFDRALIVNPKFREAQVQLDKVRLAQRDADSPQTAEFVKSTQALVWNLGPSARTRIADTPAPRPLPESVAQKPIEIPIGPVTKSAGDPDCEQGLDPSMLPVPQD